MGNFLLCKCLLSTVLKQQLQVAGLSRHRQEQIRAGVSVT